ncbi:hypothetical protein BH23BAC1_BH23BAC1_49060 [soil metagenome]
MGVNMNDKVIIKKGIDAGAVFPPASQKSSGISQLRPKVKRI